MPPMPDHSKEKLLELRIDHSLGGYSHREHCRAPDKTKEKNLLFRLESTTGHENSPSLLCASEGEELRLIYDSEARTR